MRVFAPAAFRWPAQTGSDYPYGWQEIGDDSLIRTLKAAGLVTDGVLTDPDDVIPRAQLVTASPGGLLNGYLAAPGSPTIGIVGDSLLIYGIRPGPLFTNGTTIPGINLGGAWCSIDCSVATTGLFEYRAADRSVRFTAPGDTPGPWVPVLVSKRAQIPSGTPAMYCETPVFPARLGAVDASSVMTFLAPPSYTGLTWQSVPTWIEVFSGQRLQTVNACAAGALIDDLSDLLDDLKAREAASGVRLTEVWFQFGTNHVTSGAAPDVNAMLAQYSAGLVKAKQYGWRPRVFSVPMRDLSAGSAAQIAWRAFNKALPALCRANNAIYSDIWAHTNDPASATLPVTGMTTDNIHPSSPGAFRAALTLWSLLGGSHSGGQSPLFISAADAYNSGTNPTGNMLPGTPAGSTGTAGAGGTATDLATNWDVRRNTGSITIVADKVDLLDGGQKWQRLTLGAAAAVSDEAKLEYGTLGVGVTTVTPGDVIEVLAELNVPAVAGLRRLAMWITFVGAARNDSSIWETFDTAAGYPALPAVAWPGTPVVKLPRIKVPASTTSMRVRFFIGTDVGATPNVMVRGVSFRKV